MSAAEVNVSICTALGVDPRNVRAITISLRQGRFPLVTIEKLETDEDGLLNRALSRFELVDPLRDAKDLVPNASDSTS